jgi:DNA-directed RNA polymerase sigma subunit (sigma70/sigma32)
MATPPGMTRREYEAIRDAAMDAVAGREHDDGFFGDVPPDEREIAIDEAVDLVMMAADVYETLAHLDEESADV